MSWFGACCARSSGLRDSAAVSAWHLSVCLRCGRRPACLACLVAPRGALLLVRSSRSRCSCRLSRRRGAFSQPGGLRPRLYWVAARGTRRPAENRAHCACRWPPPRQGLWARSALYLFGALRWGCPWRVPPASILGRVRCGGWRVWTPSLTRPSSRTVRRSTGDSVGAPGLFCVDADTSPCGSEDATPGSPACVRVLVRPGRVGRAGLPGAFWCASPFPFAASSFCFAWPPPSWVCPGLGPLFSRRLLFCFVFFSVSLLFFSLRRLCLLLSLVSGPGCPGPWRFVLFVLLVSRFLALRALSLSLCFLAVGRSLVVAPPPPLSRAVVAVPCCLAFVFFFPLVCAPLFLAFCVFRPRVPRALALVCVCCARLSVLCVIVFFSPPCTPAFFVSPGWLLVAAPPAPPFCVSRFSLFLLCALVFLFDSCAPPLSPAFSGFRPRVTRALALFFVCLSRPPAARLSVRARLVCVSRLAVGCSLVVAAPPPPLPFCVSPFSSLLLGALVFFSSSVHPRCLQLSLVSGPRCPGPRRCALFALLAFRFSAPCALSPPSCCPPGRWLLPGGFCPPPFVSRGFRRCRSVLCAVCCAVLCVPGCGAAPRCCALCRLVLCSRVLCCFVAPVGCCCLLRHALWHCPLPWGPVLCGAVFCGVPPCCVLCAVCVLSWRGGACCCLPLCFVLFVSRGAVLCVPCPLCSVRCCASLCWCACVVVFVWCVLLLAPGAVVRCCALCCFLWCAVVRCWVWWPVVVCWWRVSVSVSLSDRLVCFPVVGVVCCCALLPCVVSFGAVLSRGAVLLCSAVVLRCCLGLFCPPVACHAVLCCAVGWLCCFLPGGGVCVLWCSFPRAVRSLSSPLCALRCLVVLAVVPCFPVSCAVALCCRVVLCCRALLSFCGAVCVCFVLLWPVVRRRAVLCCAVGCLCCFFAPWWRLCAVVPFPSLPAGTKKIN